jgi:hypothetical protein
MEMLWIVEQDKNQSWISGFYNPSNQQKLILT